MCMGGEERERESEKPDLAPRVFFSLSVATDQEGGGRVPAGRPRSDRAQSVRPGGVGRAAKVRNILGHLCHSCPEGDGENKK